MDKKKIEDIKTLGDLKKSGWKSVSVKEEMRANLIEKLQKGQKLFEGIWGYEESVLPEIERAILARHNINFLGLRGQAKTRMARSLINLLDEHLPAIEGSDINDDPYNPISHFGREIVAVKGDKTPIIWIDRQTRYTEKLATPDVTVADLIGDSDPIKAANLKLSYDDERVIHFGLVPRANRGLFVINELPDLQPRIQVALFNILQEGDIQIRGFKLRLPLDIVFVFTANPEDYTNRGAIITPLKDRIQSQIITHYPRKIEISKSITEQEARLTEDQEKRVYIPNVVKNLIEQIAIEARQSEFVDQKSGVSARLTISAYELLYSTVERRALMNKEKKASARIGDLASIVPAITGKVELVYEGEQEGAASVAFNLIGKAIRSQFVLYFPDPELARKRKNEINPYHAIINWFRDKDMELPSELSDSAFEKELRKIPRLDKLAEKYAGTSDKKDLPIFMEFILHGLAEYSLLGKHQMEDGLTFSDMFSSVFSADDLEDE